MASDTFFKKYNEIDISITEQGKFKATIKGRIRILTNLRDLEKEIDGTGNPTIGYEINSNTPQTPHQYAILRFESDGRARYVEGGLSRTYDKYYDVSEEQMSVLIQFLREQSELEHRWSKFVETLPRITKTNVKELSGNTKSELLIAYEKSESW